MSLELMPGAALIEADLANRLGTSKTPVREGLRRLETEGLVVIAPYRGATVAPIVAQDIQQIYEVRGALEGMVARLAANRLTPEQLQQLASILAAADDALARGLITETSTLGSDFHNYLVLQVGNQRISAILTNLGAHLERFHRVLEQIPGRIARSIQEHRLIYEAVACGDQDGAQKAMIEHVESFMTEFLRDFGAITTHTSSIGTI